jgi:hypothetical protein
MRDRQQGTLSAAYTQVEDAEACEPIPLPARAKLRVVHYYDLAKWKPRGNWANGRWVNWTKKTTRPMDIWPELWNTTGTVAQQQASIEWRKEVQRRAVHDRAARKRKIIREPGEAQDPIVEEEPQPEMATAAANPFNMEAWKPWLREVHKLCDLHIPEMPLLKHHIPDHLQPPKHRQRCKNMPWNCCVARPVFKDEIRRQPGAQAALRKEWDRLRAINTWLEDEVEMWDVVKARAEKQGVQIHMGMVFQICVEKDSETEKEEWLRKWKGRVVFCGNDVVDKKIGTSPCFKNLAAPSPWPYQ